MNEKLIEEILSINRRISVLESERTNLVQENAISIINQIFGLMDWDKSDLIYFKIEYSDFEQHIMIQVFLKSDNARYVFSLGCSGTPKLKFREVL